MASSPFEIPPGIRRAMDYGKLAGAVPRMLVLQSRYWLDDACIRCAGMLEWQVKAVPVAQEGILPRDAIAQLLKTIVDFKPDFILSINLSGMDVDGLLARLFEDLRLPYVAWFADDPRTIIMNRPVYASPYAIALTWESAYCPYLAACGFPVARTLPLAVDPNIFNAGPSTVWQHPPTFVGNSMAAPARYEWEWINQRPRLASAVQAALENDVTRERFAQGLDALLEPAFVATLDEHERRHAEILMFVEGTRRLRRKLVELLDPEGLHVRGDESWGEISSHAGGPINYERDLATFYHFCEINLNVTSVQMATAPNQRVFDCPAAGGFLLTDAQPALRQLFDEDEMACYGSFDECRDLMRWYRANPELRCEVTTRARNRIMAHHTYAHRLEAMVDILREYLNP